MASPDRQEVGIRGGCGDFDVTCEGDSTAPHHDRFVNEPRSKFRVELTQHRAGMDRKVTMMLLMMI